MALELRAVELANEGDDEGALVLKNGAVIAILSRLSDQHSDKRGRWYVECAFGVLGSWAGTEFRDLEQASAALDSALNKTRGLRPPRQR